MECQSDRRAGPYDDSDAGTGIPGHQCPPRLLRFVRDPSESGAKLTSDVTSHMPTSGPEQFPVCRSTTRSPHQEELDQSRSFGWARRCPAGLFYRNPSTKYSWLNPLKQE